MLIVKTTYHTNPTTGAGKVTAKALGKQRTVSYNHDGGQDVSHGAAVGAVLDAVLDDRQKAMLRHPSGANRVRVKMQDDTNGFPYLRWSIDV